MGTHKKNRMIWRLSILAGLFVLALADWLLIEIQLRNYDEKIEILSVMIEEQKKGADSLSTAAGLLKGTGDSAGETGRDILKSYGYLEGQINCYSLELKHDIGKILLLSGVLFGLYLLLILWMYRFLKEQNRQELRKLGMILEGFQKRVYDLDIEKEYQGRDEVLERIYGQLELLREMLLFHEERLAQEKEETKSLVTDISHQLKTPVAGLKACFEILQQEQLSPAEREEFLAQCSRQLQGLEALVGALVNISRMETGMIQIKKDPADILETLVAAVNRVWLKAEEKQIAIEFEESEDLGSIEIPHDRKWMCEAFINILENAVKYSPSQTTIRIRMMKRTTFLRIEIEDEGIGIPKEDYHKIFKRFYRGDSREVKEAEGSGVGLYLTREIIGRHGGSVTVSSRTKGEHRGSTFVVQLPYRL